MANVTPLYNVTQSAPNDTGSDVIGSTSRYTVAETVAVGLVLVMLIVVTVGGNLLVCVTVATDRKLRTATNYFLLSLAVTDLLLGCSVLPVSAFATLNGDRAWTLGAAFCNVYVSTDVTLCTASILILFAISLDRSPVASHNEQTVSRRRCFFLFVLCRSFPTFPLLSYVAYPIVFHPCHMYLSSDRFSI